MAASRTAIRPLRALRARPTAFRPSIRSYATAQEASSHRNSAVIGGLVGGAAVFAVAYGWYSLSGAKAAVNSIHQTKLYFDKATQKFSESTPEPNEVIKWLRDTSLAYAAFIPGAKSYVNTVFDDLDVIRRKHGSEVDSILREAYNELKAAVKNKGISVETAREVYAILEKHLKQISSLAGDAIDDILDNHPDLKSKVGGNIEQLRGMGEKYGPQAKEQIDKTWDQIRSIVSKGVSVDAASEIRNVVQEKIDLLRKMGEEAFKQGMKQAKPYLDKSPKVKELVEKNADALRQGNVSELWDKVKDAVNSGSTGDLESFIKSATDTVKSKGKSMGVDVDKYLKAIPGASDIMQKLQQLQEIGQKHGKEAEDILKSTMEEIKTVLQRGVGDAQKLADKARKETK